MRRGSIEYCPTCRHPNAAPQMDQSAPSITKELPRSQRSELFWAVWAVAAAFGTYFCMYAFRKPFTAATFDDASVGGLTFKTLLVTAQVTGYMVSKFIGIKVISEMPAQRRAVGIVALIVAAELALVLFGLTPRPWSAVWLFCNGLPLGMVFGLVLGFLEGRRSTEALAAGLCASFILADGVMKSVGKWLLEQHVSEDWMPAAAGLIFLLPLGLCVAVLSSVPPPSPHDLAARAERTPMTAAERRSLLRRYALGLVLLVTMYLLVTIVRSIRSDFAPEIWSGLGIHVKAEIYSWSEICVALGVLLVNGGAVLVRDSRRAFFLSLAVCCLGFTLMMAVLIGLRLGVLGGFSFVVMIGLGLYLPYVAMHTTVFERFLAMTRERGNLGFLMYLADAIGYLGYVGVMLSRHSVQADKELLAFFIGICWLSAGASVICLAVCWLYFAQRCPAPQFVSAKEELT